MPERPEFWGIPKPLGSNIVYVLMALAAVILLVRFYKETRLWWQIGQNEKRWDKPISRIIAVMKYGIFQIRLANQGFQGIVHIVMAWSFFMFFLATAAGTINGHFFEFLVGDVFLVFKLFLDIFTLLFFISAAIIIGRRYAVKPDRLTYEPKFTRTLILIVLIVFTGLLIESARLAVEQPAWAAWTPLGWAIAQIWIGTGLAGHPLHQIVYSTHVLLVAGTLIALPVGTLLHTLTSPINMFFSKLEPTGKLRPLEEDEDGEYIFADKLSNLTWKQLLDGDACTECGRCQEACPAYASGLPLNPKEVILMIRNALHRDGPNWQTLETKPQLIGEDITEDVLWACTTCNACVSQCPVLIEHVDTIVDMRRHLVNEGQIDELLQDALANLGRYGNSFGQSERARAKWAKEYEPKIKNARKEAVEYLWFVGDYASYNPALTEITRQTAEVFQKVGLDFGILYEAERNSGNDARRVGEEGLFEHLVEKNTATLAKCDFKALITTDPHTYNTLKNEYPEDVIEGRPVLHYAELLDQLIASGQLKLNKKLGYKVTYHDPCYLGRYNGVYDAPRRVIEATGCQVIEMPRNRAHAFCCGAGGGRIWMDEGEMKERPAENRISEAAALNNVSMFVVACPKDISMYQDAVKTKSMEDRLVVKDLIELVYEAL